MMEPCYDCGTYMVMTRESIPWGWFTSDVRVTLNDMETWKCPRCGYGETVYQCAALLSDAVRQRVVAGIKDITLRFDPESRLWVDVP